MPPSAEEVALKHHIDRLYTASPFYGSRRITAALHREGVIINRKAVQRHMHEMGIAGVAPGPHLSTPAPQHPIYPYLLRHVTSARAQPCLGHRHHLYKNGGRMALPRRGARLVLPLRRELGAGPDPRTALCPGGGAARAGPSRPAIWNSDQGSHFTSPQYLTLLQDASVQISMDGKGRALDNIFTERLWRTIKYEEVYLHSYAHPKEARQSLTRYLDFYNHRRPHQALGYRTPAEVYDATSDHTARSGAETGPLAPTWKGGDPTLGTAILLS